jgi:hypothetical protein
VIDDTAIVAAFCDRFWSKVTIAGADDCWLWRAGVSRSGRREVDYGCFWEGRPSSRTWRANRLALLLESAPASVPRALDEPFIAWLVRANAEYRAYEAAHGCDVSMCVNPRHLAWLTHAENIHQQ